MKIRINKDFGDFKKGQIANVKSDGGIPLDSFWRRRLVDAKQDGCCKIVEESESKTKAKAKSKVIKNTDK